MCLPVVGLDWWHLHKKSCEIEPNHSTAYVCLSMTTEEPLLAFSWNIILETITKFWQIISKFAPVTTGNNKGRSQWPRGLRRRSAAARLLRLWVRIPPGAWMFDCCECCVLSGRGLCDGLITHPEESYRLWCVVVCGLESSRMRGPWPALGRSATGKKEW